MSLHPYPDGQHTITPCLALPRAGKVISFLQEAFNGQTVERYDGPEGSVLHAKVKIGDSIILIGEPMPGWDAMPSSMMFYVPSASDVDETYERALSVGALSVTSPKDEFFGLRTANVKDMAGNLWTIAAVIEQMSMEEKKKRTDDQMKDKNI